MSSINGVNLVKKSLLVATVLLSACATAPNEQKPTIRDSSDYPAIRYIRIKPVENMSWLPLEKRAAIASLLEAGKDGASRTFGDNTYATVFFTDKNQNPVCRSFRYEFKIYTGCREFGTWTVK